jgi:carbon storage regulator
MIDDRIEIKVLEMGDGKIKIGIEAPKNISILRKEVFDDIKNENAQAANVSMDSFSKLKNL